MKRSYGVYLFVCAVLGITISVFLMQAIANSSIFYGVLTVIVVIASVLHTVYGTDRSDKK